MNTPVSGNERGLGAAAVTQSAGQCFPLDLYYSRLDEPRPGVGLLRKHRWSGGGSQVRFLYYADRVIIQILHSM